MLPQLSNPEVYRSAAERVRKRQQRRGPLQPLSAAGPCLTEIDLRTAALLERLAREVTTQYYVFSPVVRRSVSVRGRVRTVYRAAPLDDIVLGALAKVLAELIDPSLSPRLFSYRSGKSALHALRELRSYLRQHAEAQHEPRRRGLYVLRRDIAGYGDTIPADTRSRLWQLLAASLQRAGIEPTERLLQWLRAAFRPAVQSAAGLEVPELGVPTGSPLQPLACNLYLAPLDTLCGEVPGAFYARYGDDILFAHPDLQLVRQMRRALDAAIGELGLSANAAKSHDAYFTLPGRAASDTTFQGSAHLEYLGVRLDFRGAFGLKRDKERALLRELRARLSRSSGLLAGAPNAQRIEALVRVANQALSANSPVAAAHAQLLASTIDDRRQLRDLDYKLARMLAETATGDPSVRALRLISPRQLRRDGYVSLVQRRNRGASQLR